MRCVQWNLVDVLLPPGELVPLLQSDRILQAYCVAPVGISCGAPECSIFDLGDFKIDCLCCFGFIVLYHNAHDAGREEMIDHGFGDETTFPVCGLPLFNGVKSARHCGPNKMRSSMQVGENFSVVKVALDRPVGSGESF